MPSRSRQWFWSFVAVVLIYAMGSWIKAALDDAEAGETKQKPGRHLSIATCGGYLVARLWTPFRRWPASGSKVASVGPRGPRGWPGHLRIAPAAAAGPTLASFRS